jgi:YihY family inner membrane protein
MPSVARAVGRLKRLRPVAAVLAVQERYGNEGAGLFASAIAYHAFFSLFPLLLVAVAGLGFVLDDPATRRDVIQRITQTIPGLGDLMGESIDAIVEARAATGIVGVLGFVWTGTAVVRSAGAALGQIFEAEPREDNVLKQNLWALGSLVTLAGVAGASTGLTFAGGIAEGPLSALVLGGGLLVDVGLFVVAYRVLTRGPGPSIRVLVPGALVAAIAWAILKFAGSWYAQRTLAGASAVYGTFAGAIGILAVLSLGARIFLYGAVVSDMRMKERAPATHRVDERRASAA